MQYNIFSVLNNDISFFFFFFLFVCYEISLDIHFEKWDHFEVSRVDG